MKGTKNKEKESKVICFVAFNQTLHKDFDYSGEEHGGMCVLGGRRRLGSHASLTPPRSPASSCPRPCPHPRPYTFPWGRERNGGTRRKSSVAAKAKQEQGCAVPPLGAARFGVLQPGWVPHLGKIREVVLAQADAKHIRGVGV